VDISSIRVDDFSQNDDLKSLLGPDLFDDFFGMIYEYFREVIRLEAIFEEKGLRFGMHSTESVDESFNSLYTKKCPDVTDFILYHNNRLRQLYGLMIQVLTKMG
jgi:hypothetical protein